MRIISCNIRFSSMDIGKENLDWKERKSLCCSVIALKNPDIIALQECHNDQFKDIRDFFGMEWGAFWMMSYPDGRYPENAIFYRKSKFEVLNCGGYWLSETPHLPGSSSWNSECVRFANYLLLSDGRNEFRILNTHIDHASQEARIHQSSMITEESSVWGDEIPQILSGDMNCDYTNGAVRNFLSAGWRDSYMEATGIEEPGFTFHAFQGGRWNGDMGICGNGKMDWIFLRGGLRATDAEVVKENSDPVYPSDHYFVTADVEFV